MAKYVDVTNETQKTFDEVLENTSIPHWIEFTLKSYSKLKEIYQIKKLNDLVEDLTEGLNFVIIINEDIFEQLDNNHQKIIFDEALAGVSISEQDAVSYQKPNFTTYRGVLEKYGHEEIITIKESIKSLFDAKKQQEEEEKAARKAAKNKKKKF